MLEPERRASPLGQPPEEAPLTALQRYIAEAQHFPEREVVDWQHAPLKYKVYRGGDCLRLAFLRPPLPGASQEKARQPFGAAQFGQMLAAIYGLTRQRWTGAESYNAIAAGSTLPILDPHTHPFKQDLLRPVPSGGGLYPCEVYAVIGAGQALPAGVYHYDPIHHALDVIQDAGACSEQDNQCLTALLETLLEPPACNADFALVLSCFFWKNAFKYGEFAYRLQGLDLGIVLGQALAVGSSYGLESSVHFRFVDSAVNALLKLDEAYESAYAVIVFSLGDRPRAPGAGWQRWQKAAASPSSVADERARLQPLSSLPLSAALHRASLIRARSHPQPQPGDLGAEGTLRGPAAGATIAMSDDLGLELARGTPRRHSARYYFQPGLISEQQCAQLLYAAGRALQSDLTPSGSCPPRLLLYCLVAGVHGLDPGIYCYTPGARYWQLVRPGDSRLQLQQIVAHTGYHNVYHINLHIFPVGEYSEGVRRYGPRWYRIQNMLAGSAIQRLYLAAALLGLGCHTSLAYSIEGVNRLLGLERGATALAQVLIAPERLAGQYYELPLAAALAEAWPEG
ncbi:SagB family peptide dehydrogenase [Thermogemmatispora onikobensis]|uniref:SagB family peptide dehydrogenase n=1 Tax=Thermogemmatispora onikobensis TaxID=732234 RepID=UPI000852E9E2|nr:SagB family peptide dehydrogenase [Thermogemmatispora onikobensis]